MDTRNLKKVTSALSAFWQGIGCLSEKDWGKGEQATGNVIQRRDAAQPPRVDALPAVVPRAQLLHNQPDFKQNVSVRADLLIARRASGGADRRVFLI
ncbi:hypothetical protein EVAR_51689_1 [Eumeta japonica]|uniref:Uncharacterized protein n=1 Tax=Eumeta variegata TaxID=151549 RepID=A0A4C1Y384_EUMVA|nr:hypothetical protein EVAR_51689_1 [Eumeta japonica]